MKTPRLILRNRTRALIKEMLEQPIEAQMKFFGFETKAELEEKLIRIEKGLANTNVDYRIFDFVEKASMQVIGSAGFHNWIKDHDRAEIGYALHEKFRGKGFMTEALEQIISYGFNEMNLNRIEALIEPDNQKSMYVVQKFGFVKEGVLQEHYKEDGEYDDSVLYALLKRKYFKENDVL